jgi:S1-C subfamily serine protease
MPRVLAFCLLALFASPLPQPAGAGDLLFEPLDAARLGVAEARLLQTALAAAGDYPDPPDGSWGPLSQQALEAYATREFEDGARNLYAAALVIGLMDVIEAQRWSSRYLPALGLSLALPEALGEPEDAGGARVWRSRDGSLSVLARGLDAGGARAWHDAVAAGSDVAAIRTLRRDGLLVTEGRLAGGRRFHLRSDRVAGRWPTVRIDGGPADAGDIDLIRAGIRPGLPVALDLPPGGYLDRIVAGTLALLEVPWQVIPASRPVAAPPEAAALPPVAPDIAATGSGFYVSDRLLVTAEHVVRDCARLALADGTGLAMLAGDPDLDVAVLAAPRPARAWLSLDRGDTTRLGERVHAAGFPYYSIAGTSLHLTGGNVSALAGVDDDRRFFSFTAPIQPGNSGGPLIDGGGEVLGVVVSRLSESYIAETTGSVPQNVNYALSTAELAGFLGRAGVRAAAGGLGGFDMDRGAPTGFEAAVVPIICR